MDKQKLKKKFKSYFKERADDYIFLNAYVSLNMYIRYFGTPQESECLNSFVSNYNKFKQSMLNLKTMAHNDMEEEQNVSLFERIYRKKWLKNIDKICSNFNSFEEDFLKTTEYSLPRLINAKNFESENEKSKLRV